MYKTQNPYLYNSRFRKNKAHIEEIMYRTAYEHGMISNVLTLVGTDFERHVRQAFRFIARPYQGVQKAKVIIAENDSNMTGTYMHLLKERSKFPPGHLFRRKVEIYNTDVVNIAKSYRFEDMDLCASPKETWYVLKERLRQQSRIRSRNSYLKAYIFTWCERNFGRENSFKFLREMCSILGAHLSGMNYARGKWYLLKRAREIGKYLPKNINMASGSGTYAYEHTPNFGNQGRIITCRVFNYNGLTDIGNKTAPMVTGIIIYV